MDVFVEQMIKRKLGAKDYLIAVGISIVAIILIFLCLTVFAQIIGSLFVLIIGGIAYIAYRLIKTRFLEFEYSFTNGTLDFAKVLRSVKRKELGSMNVANVAACGHVAHDSFRKFLAMKDVTKRNWFLNRDGNLFYFYYVKENKKNMIIIEPSEEMVEMIRHYLPVGVYQG